MRIIQLTTRLEYAWRPLHMHIKAFAAGCDAYIAKPFSPRALLAKVREYLP